MVEIHSLAPGLGEEHVTTSEAHVEALPGAVLAAVGGEDHLLQASGA